MADLARIVTAARAVQVDDAHAANYVRQLRLDQTHVAVPVRSWLPWTFALTASVAAATFAVMWWRSPSAPPATIAVQPVPMVIAPLPVPVPLPSPIAEPVVLRLAAAAALVAQPGADLAVAASSATMSTLRFTQGVVSFRVGAGHQLRIALHDGELLLRAGGASIVTDEHESSIRLDDGNATFTDTSGRVRPLPFGQQARFAASSELAVVQLRSLALDLPLQPTGAAQTSQKDQAGSATVNVTPVATPVVEQWRLVRLLRGQGNFAAAIKLAHQIGELGDATWSPIALLEAARIELGPLLSSAQAIKTCDTLLKRYPTHALAREAADLRCRALTELGRSGECQPAAH